MDQLRVMLSAYRPDRLEVAEPMFRDLLPPALADRHVEGLDVPDCAALLVLAGGAVTDWPAVIGQCTEHLRQFDPAKLDSARSAGLHLNILVSIRTTMNRFSLALPLELTAELARLRLPVDLLCDLS